MNAFRNIRVLAFVGLLTLVVLGLGAASAEAGNKCYYGGGYGSSYCYTPSYSKTCYYPSYNYCNYGYGYDYSCYYPKFCSYPVTTYDCFGRPYTVWQSGYGITPVSYLP